MFIDPLYLILVLLPGMVIAIVPPSTMASAVLTEYEVSDTSTVPFPVMK